MRYVVICLGSMAAACSFSATSNPGASADARASGSDGGDTPDATADAPAADLAPCDPTRGDLVACFTFDGGDPDDSIGDVGASTVLGTPATVAGVDGDAIAFDGDDNLVVGPDADLDVTEWTFDAWVNATAPGSGRAAILDIDGNFGSFIHPGGEFRCGVGSTGEVTSDDTGSALSDGVWHHVACRLTPGRGFEAFIDGDVVACSTTANAVATNAEPLMIGANSPDNSSRLDGAIDNLRIWDQTLSDAALCAAAGKQPGTCQVLAAGCDLP